MGGKCERWMERWKGARPARCDWSRGIRSDNVCSRHGFHVADCNFAGLKHHNCSGPFQRCLLVPNPQSDLLYAHVHMYPVFFMTSHANAALIPFSGLQAMMLLQVDPRPAQ